MAKRLTEDDIRRIFRDEVERDRAEQARLKEFPEDVHAVWAKLKDRPAKYKEEMVQEVIDTYWEVVEEDLNE